MIESEHKGICNIINEGSSENQRDTNFDSDLSVGAAAHIISISAFGMLH